MMTNDNGKPISRLWADTHKKKKKYGLKLVNGKKQIFDYSIWKFMF